MITPMERAIGLRQYDSDELGWEKEANPESGRTLFFWEYLEPYISRCAVKNVLDVGAGSGWLVKKASEYGARAIGIEPSRKNVSLARRLHPEISMMQETLESFEDTGERFDLITAVMLFPHVDNIDHAFKNMSDVLADEGEVIIVIPDYDYFRGNRHGYAIKVEDIDPDQYVVEITRSSGVIADIVRRSRTYIEAARGAGFECVEEKAMYPTEAQIARSPKYATVKDQPITHLLRFRKM